jgi:L-fuconate dehydratase
LKASEGELIRLSDPKITNVRVLDLRFPTSRHQIGSDAVNTDPDYSAAYCILETDVGIEGYGLTFTLGHGTELCVLALEYLARFVQGRNLSSLTDDTVAFSRQLTEDTQFRWLGPEKGVIHLAAAALINAVWDLYARTEGKPLWKLLADFEPEQIVRSIDFRYIEDAITPGEALDLLRTRTASQAGRLNNLQRRGYPAYTTSAGRITGQASSTLFRILLSLVTFRGGLAQDFRPTEWYPCCRHGCTAKRARFRRLNSARRT